MVALAEATSTETRRFTCAPKTRPGLPGSLKKDLHEAAAARDPKATEKEAEALCRRLKRSTQFARFAAKSLTSSRGLWPKNRGGAKIASDANSATNYSIWIRT